MLHPKEIFYFAYSSSTDPLAIVGKKLPVISVMRAVLPSYKRIKSSRLGRETIRKQANANVEGLVYLLTETDFYEMERHAEELEKISRYVMILDTNLLQEVVFYKPKVQKQAAHSISL